MPELPDIELYLAALRPRVEGETLAGIRLASPFLLRSVDPPVAEAAGHTVEGLERLGKRIVFNLSGDIFIVLHLMIAGRLQWKDAGAAIPGGKRGLAAFDFGSGSLILTEAGTKKRAALHLVRSRDGLAALDPGGVNLADLTEADFTARLRSANHTLKRILTDPKIFSGIGNAYSDEILHRAGLSPIAMSQKLDEAAAARLYAATCEVLDEWTARLIAETGETWPGKVTAFRPEMAVHGKYGEPCPVCGTEVQRIRHASNETNYCPRCQTEGKVLADRSLSRLLKKDWPRSIEELEAR